MKRIDYSMLGYAVGGTLVNILSVVRVRLGETPLSPRDPIVGIGLMLLVACVAGIGIAGRRRLSALLLLPITILISLGTISHVIAPLNPQWHNMYASSISWFLVTALNIFGVVSFFIAMVMAFKWSRVRV